MTTKLIESTRRALLFLAALTVVALAGCQADKPVSPAKPAAEPSAMSQAGLQVYWERQIAMASGERAVNLWLMDENLYFLTNQKTLIAIDAKTGLVKWRTVVTYKAERVFAPTHFDDMHLPKKVGTVEDIKTPPGRASLPKFDALLINTLSSMKVIDRATGEIIRDIRFQSFFAVNRGVTDGERFYVAGSDKQLHAIALLPAVKVWSHEIEARILAPTQCDEDGRVLAGATDGQLQCLWADGYGKRRWGIKFASPITAPMAVDDGQVYVASQDGRTYALAANGGRELWLPVQTPGRPAGGVLAGKSTIYVSSRPGGVTAIDRASGKIRWNVPTGQAILAVIDGKVYLQDQVGDMLVVQAKGGLASDKVPLGRYELFATNISAPAIYVATKDGKLTCIRQANQARLTAEMLKK